MIRDVHYVVGSHLFYQRINCFTENVVEPLWFCLPLNNQLGSVNRDQLPRIIRVPGRERNLPGLLLPVPDLHRQHNILRLMHRLILPVAHNLPMRALHPRLRPMHFLDVLSAVQQRLLPEPKWNMFPLFCRRSHLLNLHRLRVLNWLLHAFGDLRQLPG
jgi:hypothetical protein